MSTTSETEITPQYPVLREPGYYWILPSGSEDWMIGYWYEGIVDASGAKSKGHFDCSNHWNSDFDIVYSVVEIGERLLHKSMKKAKK